MKEIIYELAYLISGQLNETEAQDLAKKIEKTLGESGVIVNSIEPKKIKLAYPIKKQGEGFLVSIDFTAEPNFILLLSREIEKETNILRFLIIKKSPEKPEDQKEKRKIIIEEKPEAIVEKVKKEKIKKSAFVETSTVAKALADKTVGKEEDLKKIEKDLDEILGQ